MRKYIKDIVYGANDGIITTFAVIAGVSGAALSSNIIVIVGMATLFADGFSMASSSYLSQKSDNAVTHSGTNPVPGALATFFAFIIAGFVPLLPYLLGVGEFKQAIVFTAIALFLVGGLRTFVTGRNFLRGALEMLIVGGVAASLAYFVGGLISGLV